MAKDSLHAFKSLVDPVKHGKVLSWDEERTSRNWRHAVGPERFEMPEDSTDPLRQAVVAHLKRSGQTKSAMSLAMGVNVNYVHQFLRGHLDNQTARSRIREYLTSYDYNKPADAETYAGELLRLRQMVCDLEVTVQRQQQALTELKSASEQHAVEMQAQVEVLVNDMMALHERAFSGRQS